MGRDELRARANWQKKANEQGKESELAFDGFMWDYLETTDFEMEWEPKDLAGIYGVSEKGNPHGIWPECALRNSETGKTIYVEIKRQGKGGNAHERACKYFTPGIIMSAREIANQPEGVIPFWWVFTNGLARYSRYQREIMHWFVGMEGQVLLWRDIDDPQVLIEHFDKHIRPLLM